jgi:hypothetical protein
MNARNHIAARLTVARLTAAAALLLLMSVPALGQSVTVQELRVQRDRPDEVFYRAGTTVTFRIVDEAGPFETILDGKSDITVFRDDAGTDLLTAHRKAVVAWERRVEELRSEGRFVSMGRDRDIVRAERFESDAELTGFYLTVESWGVPRASAESVHVKGELQYLVSTNERISKELEGVDLRSLQQTELGGYQIRLRDKSRQDGQYRMTLYTDLPLTGFVVRNEDGEEIGGIRMTMNGRPIVSLPAQAASGPVNVTLIAKKPLRRTLELSKSVTPGLAGSDGGE